MIRCQPWSERQCLLDPSFIQKWGENGGVMKKGDIKPWTDHLPRRHQCDWIGRMFRRLGSFSRGILKFWLMRMTVRKRFGWLVDNFLALSFCLRRLSSKIGSPFKTILSHWTSPTYFPAQYFPSLWPKNDSNFSSVRSKLAFRLTLIPDANISTQRDDSIFQYRLLINERKNTSLQLFAQHVTDMQWSFSFSTALLIQSV